MVSIIIPTYNRLPLLKRAIASIEAQTFQDFELIIVDDASTDGTQEYLRSIRHKSLCLSTNRGVSFARNRGVELASFEYIAFLDSDDLWEEDKLAKQIAFHLAHNRAVTYTNERWFRLDQEVTLPKKYQKPHSVTFEDLIDYTFIGPSSIMMSKALFYQAGGFDETLPACEDFDLWLRIALIEPMFLVPDAYIQKHAGDHAQLSTQYKALDYYRVQALLKHRESRSSLIEPLIRKKLEALHLGAIKHQNEEIQKFCERLNALYFSSSL